MTNYEAEFLFNPKKGLDSLPRIYHKLLDSNPEINWAVGQELGFDCIAGKVGGAEVQIFANTTGVKQPVIWIDNIWYSLDLRGDMSPKEWDNTMGKVYNLLGGIASTYSLNRPLPPKLGLDELCKDWIRKLNIACKKD